MNNSSKPYILFLLAALTAIFTYSCHPGDAGKAVLLPTGGDAVSPYLTMDEKGVPVLCWTEKAEGDSVYSLKFAWYQADRHAFGAAITVPGSGGAQTAAESMNKVAFKSDGSVVAVFGKKFLNEKNPYAGAIYYTISADKGETWADPAFLHTDTIRDYGRGFFDLARMRTGEVAAVWLDGRHGRSEKGSALYYNCTSAGQGFGTDRLIDKMTCECCRTALLADAQGNLHVAFRKILYPAEKLGKPVRDLVYSASGDNGRTFSTPVVISRDGWVLDGCPHTGPAMAMGGRAPAAIWFTAGGEPGLYFTGNVAGNKTRTLLSRTGRHPQLVSLGQGSLAAIWEESVPAMTPKKPAGHHSAHGSPGGGVRVILIDPKGAEKTIFAETSSIPRHHPVMLKTQGGLLAAWVAETKAGPRIEFLDLSTRNGL